MVFAYIDCAVCITFAVSLAVYMCVALASPLDIDLALGIAHVSVAPHAIGVRWFSLMPLLLVRPRARPRGLERVTQLEALFR